MNKILVTYASHTGAAAGVAEAIGKVLLEKGALVDVLPMKDVSDLHAYQAVVVGSAINGGTWLPEALDFIKVHQAELTRKPCAVFLVCMTLAMTNGEQYRSHVSSWLAPVRALIKPVSEGLFAGTLDIEKIPSWGDRIKFRLSVLLGVWKEGDHRDWSAIRAWGESVYPLILPGL